MRIGDFDLSDKCLLSWHRVFVVALLLLLCGCVPTTQRFQQATLNPQDYKPVDLDLGKRYGPSEYDRAFLEFYGFDLTAGSGPVSYHQGLIEVLGTRLRVQVFQSERARGTIFAVHGYFDHAGSLGHLVNRALSEEYDVVVYDLPGHGHSAGSRGATGGMRLNAVILEEIAARLRKHLVGPCHVIGFSTGGSIVLAHHHHFPDHGFSKAVVLAPLLRHASWHWGRLGYWLVSPFMDRIRQREQENSNDTRYLQFVRNDPLRGRFVAFSFLDDLYRWVPGFTENPQLAGELLVLQGAEDEIVDWRYNLPMLRRSIGENSVHLIAGGKHQLLNETPHIRNEALDNIFGFFKLASEDNNSYQ